MESAVSSLGCRVGRCPVVFLDVDGTLLPFGSAPGRDEANTEIASRLGLPRLPVVRWPEPSAAEEREDQWFGVHWKTRGLVAWADGRPFV